VLDEELLGEAPRLSGETTCSATVMRALDAFVRRAEMRQTLALRGAGLWEGAPSEMRRDRDFGGLARIPALALTPYADESDGAPQAGGRGRPLCGRSSRVTSTDTESTCSPGPRKTPRRGRTSP